MIRTKHQIDTRLVNFFITERVFDDTVHEALINWYSSLGNKEHQITRDNAIEFLKVTALETLKEINYPSKERNVLIESFGPLELLLRLALSLGKSEGVRDHLSHTVRNVLFTNYLLKKYFPENNSGLRMQLITAVIFHDIAYPIEKLKEVAHKLGNTAFKELLNSKGDIEIELNNPDDLLEMLDFWGQIRKNLDLKLKKIADSKAKDETSNIEKLLPKITHIYREIICKAIAGKGLFDASHSISSVVLFLMPIVKYWKASKSYYEMNLNKICDICLAMTYHDRENLISSIKTFAVPPILRIMRISDELQEWDRERHSYIEDVEIKGDASTVLYLLIKLKHKGEKELCKPEYFIADKIKGLLPAIEKEIIKIDFELPIILTTECLKQRLEKKNIEGECNFLGESEGKKLELKFSNNSVDIRFK